MTDLLAFLFALLLIVPPVAQLLHRAGYSRWWTAVFFVPVVNIACLWAFAFQEWPIERARQGDEWTDVEHETCRKLAGTQRDA